MKKISVLLAFSCIFILFTSCNKSTNKTEVPAEITINGDIVYLGETTIPDMLERGYSVLSITPPPGIFNDSKYINIDVELEDTENRKLEVQVRVPYNGGYNVDSELQVAATAGVIGSIKYHPEENSDSEFIFNNINLDTLTLDYVTQEFSTSEQREYFIDAEYQNVTMRFITADPGSKGYQYVTIFINSDAFEEILDGRDYSHLEISGSWLNLIQ